MFNLLDNISPLGQLMPRLYMSFADDGAGGGDPPAGDPPAGDPPAGDPPAPAPEKFSWKSKIGEDLSKAPSLGKFEDTPEGLAEAAKSYVNLEKLLGHEKVPLPKGPDDTEGIAQFRKATGVPETAAEYNLPDADLPGDMGNLAFNKDAFQEVIHKFGLTPAQAEGLWKAYTEMSGNVYASHMKGFQDTLNKNINALRAEWGDAYAGNVELGDMVIQKFSDDQAMADFLTSALSKDPAGMRFLAKIGNQFSENKIGDFQYKRFAMTVEEAQNELARIKNDPNHAYNNERATEKDHEEAVAHVNRLLAISMGKGGEI